MKKILITLAAVFILMQLPLGAQQSIGGFNVYYGHLHNHCGISDGILTPLQAYTYAKTTGDLDFFSLADHSSALAADEWTAMKAAAEATNEVGIFTSFWGFEWTENVLGHVAVINSANYITTASPTNTFPALCNWLNNNECVAFFNHPGRNNSTGLEFSHFATTPTDKIVGMELWNKTDRFSTYYYQDGYYTNDGNLSWFDEALARGWKIGAAGSEDNHVGTWGTMTPSKLAVLASANNRTEIMNALKAKRFFTTYDKNLALSFKIGGSEMGSTVAGAYHDINISASDGENEVFTQIQLLKNGMVMNTWTPNLANPVIIINQYCYDGEYYYVRVKQADGDEAISSPVTITGTLPVTHYTFTKRITAGSDDAEQYASGTVALTSTALELVNASKTTGNQTVGLRFTGVDIPKGATITRAYIQFGASKKLTAACSLTIKGELSGNPATFTTAKSSISGRNPMTAGIGWLPSGWTAIGATGTAQQTPELKTIVQEIIGLDAWAANNSMAFIITGTGTRTAYAFEGSTAKAPLLYVEYDYFGSKVGVLASEQPSGRQLDGSVTGESSQTLVFDFSTGQEGWSGDFADYPIDDSVFYGLVFKRARLPHPLDTARYALMITGNNHSDDLFMFIKKEIKGLTPNKLYKIQIDIELASNVPTHAVGIGGAPGESVYLKAGASPIEPKKFVDEGYYRMNIDKSNQSVPGADMDTIGHIGVTDTTSVYTLINRTNAGHLFTILTDENGSVWVCIGTDSGFEGSTTLYYNTITLTFDNLTGTANPADEPGDDLLIFPNPAIGLLNIQSQTGKIKSIGLYTQDGRFAGTTGNDSQISVKHLKSGVYFVRVMFDSNRIITRQIIIR